MNMQADPLAFLENYKRIKRHRAFSVGPVGRTIYREPIGPEPRGVQLYQYPIGPMRPRWATPRDVLFIATDTDSESVVKPLTGQQIMAQEANRWGITVMDMLSSRRTKKVIIPRQICAYRMVKETRLSLPQIGRIMGGRDHTTIMHARDKIQSLIDRGELVI